MKDERDIVREKLAKFVDELNEQTFPTSTISIELAQFVASAMQSFLEKKSKSLDAAFGLTPKRGAPGYKQLKFDTAKKMLQLELAGKSKKEIADEIPRFDERKLRRIAAEFEVETTSEEICKRLGSKVKKGE